MICTIGTAPVPEGKTFLDTNVVVYAYDAAEPAKQSAAQQLLRDGARSGNVCISAQVLGEVFVVLTRKLPQPLGQGEAVDAVHALSKLEVVEIGVLAVNLALHYALRGGISYWDALIVAAARLGNCESLLTEDLRAGQVFDTVTVRNPFVQR